MRKIAELDKEFFGAIMQSVMSANPRELVNMLAGAKIDFKSSFDEIPLEISVRIRENEILARVKILQVEEVMEVEEENGDKPETD